MVTRSWCSPRRRTEPKDEATGSAEQLEKIDHLSLRHLQAPVVELVEERQDLVGVSYCGHPFAREYSTRRSYVA